MTDKENKYEVTKLKNGITILTEVSGFSCHNDLGRFQKKLFI